MEDKNACQRKRADVEQSATTSDDRGVIRCFTVRQPLEEIEHRLEETADVLATEHGVKYGEIALVINDKHHLNAGDKDGGLPAEKKTRPSFHQKCDGISFRFVDKTSTRPKPKHSTQTCPPEKDDNASTSLQSFNVKVTPSNSNTQGQEREEESFDDVVLGSSNASSSQEPMIGLTVRHLPIDISKTSSPPSLTTSLFGKRKITSNIGPACKKFKQDVSEHPKGVNILIDESLHEAITISSDDDESLHEAITISSDDDESPHEAISIPIDETISESSDDIISSDDDDEYLETSKASNSHPACQTGVEVQRNEPKHLTRPPEEDGNASTSLQSQSFNYDVKNNKNVQFPVNVTSSDSNTKGQEREEMNFNYVVLDNSSSSDDEQMDVAATLQNLSLHGDSLSRDQPYEEELESIFGPVGEDVEDRRHDFFNFTPQDNLDLAGNEDHVPLCYKGKECIFHRDNFG